MRRHLPYPVPSPGRRKVRGLLAFSSLSLLLALPLAACGTSPTAQGGGGGGGVPEVAKKAAQVYEKFNAMSGGERRKALVKAAEEEGQLSVYTSNTDMDALADAFEDKYDIDVSVYRASSETVLQRLLQENKAGFYGADFLDTNAGELFVANKEGLLADYSSELRDQVREGGQADGWTATRFNLFAIAWNTDAVAEDEVPQSLEDLADPKWKGKVSMEVGDFDWFAAMYGYYQEQGKSDAEIEELFGKIAANSKVVKGHTVQAELLSAGQYGVAVSLYNHLVDELTAKGAPVTWKPAVEPVVVRANGAAPMTTAQHPAAATLFMDFQLTEAQQIYAEQFRVGSIPTGGEDPLAGVETVSVPPEAYSNEQRWSGLYDDIVRKGQEID